MRDVSWRNGIRCESRCARLWIESRSGGVGDGEESGMAIGAISSSLGRS